MSQLIKKIFKQAWQLVLARKPLWSASLFLVWPSLFRWTIVTLVCLEQFGYATLQKSAQGQELNNNLWLALINFVVIIILMLLYFLHKSAHIIFVRNSMHQDEAHPNLMDAKSIYAEAAYSVGRLITQSFNFWFFGLLFTGLLWWPVSYLFGLGLMGRGWILAAIAAVVYLFIFGIFWFVVEFAPMFLVGYGFPAIPSVRAAMEFIYGRWRLMVQIALRIVALEIIGGAITILLAFVGSLPFVILAQIFYDVEGSGGRVMLLTLAQIAAFVLFFISQAGLALYIRTVWATMFFEIVRPVKLSPEAQPEPAPETTATQ